MPLICVLHCGFTASSRLGSLLNEFFHPVEGTASLKPGDLELIEGVVEWELLCTAILVLEATGNGLQGKARDSSELVETLRCDEQQHHMQ